MTESWDDVPIRDCYTKVQGQPCGPEHGWASWLGTFYRCTGTRTPGVAVAALDGDGRGVAAPTSPPLPVDTATINGGCGVNLTLRLAGEAGLPIS